MVIELCKETTILNVFVAELRDVEIQKDTLRFRRNLERIGEIIAYEISKTLQYRTANVITSLGEADAELLMEQPIIASILRAGLPMHNGVLNYFDKAHNAFISAYRKHHKDGTFDIQIEYLSCPDLTDKVLIICDPMLATGQSMVLTYKRILSRGRPKHTHIISAIASAEGVDYAKKHLPENTTLWIGAIDEELTAQAYIVPGLGDAGDLAYGPKI